MLRKTALCQYVNTQSQICVACARELHRLLQRLLTYARENDADNACLDPATKI